MKKYNSIIYILGSGLRWHDLDWLRNDPAWCCDRAAAAKFSPFAR